MAEKIKWEQLSRQGENFIKAIGQNRKTIDYIKDNRNKTEIVLKNNEKIIYNWRKIHLSAR